MFTQLPVSAHCLTDLDLLTVTNTECNGLKGSLYFFYCRIKEALIVKLLQTVLLENEEFQNLAGELLKKCFDEKILSKENLSKVC